MSMRCAHSRSTRSTTCSNPSILRAWPRRWAGPEPLEAVRTPPPGAVLEQIFVRDGERCWFVPLREVRLLSSEGNYIRLSWGKAKPLLGRALAALEQRLDPNRFFRANRRQIINLDFIESVDLGVNGRLHAQLRDGPEVEISRRQSRLFKTKMSV